MNYLCDIEYMFAKKGIINTTSSEGSFFRLPPSRIAFAYFTSRLLDDCDQIYIFLFLKSTITTIIIITTVIEL